MLKCRRFFVAVHNGAISINSSTTQVEFEKHFADANQNRQSKIRKPNFGKSKIGISPKRFSPTLKGVFPQCQ